MAAVSDGFFQQKLPNLPALSVASAKSCRYSTKSLFANQPVSLFFFVFFLLFLFFLHRPAVNHGGIHQRRRCRPTPSAQPPPDSGPAAFGALPVFLRQHPCGIQKIRTHQGQKAHAFRDCSSCFLLFGDQRNRLDSASGIILRSARFESAI